MMKAETADWLNTLSPELRTYAERALSGAYSLQRTLDDVTAMRLPQDDAETFLARLWQEMS